MSDKKVVELKPRGAPGGGKVAFQNGIQQMPFHVGAFIESTMIDDDLAIYQLYERMAEANVELGVKFEVALQFLAEIASGDNENIEALQRLLSDLQESAREAKNKCLSAGEAYYNKGA